MGHRCKESIVPNMSFGKIAFESATDQWLGIIQSLRYTNVTLRLTQTQYDDSIDTNKPNEFNIRFVQHHIQNFQTVA